MFASAWFRCPVLPVSTSMLSSDFAARSLRGYLHQIIPKMANWRHRKVHVRPGAVSCRRLSAVLLSSASSSAPGWPRADRVLDDIHRVRDRRRESFARIPTKYDPLAASPRFRPVGKID